MTAAASPIAEGLGRCLSPGAILRAGESLAQRTTLRVGGAAEWYVEPASESDLRQVLRYARSVGLPVMALGRGSNLLIRDGGIRGVVVCLAHPDFGRVECEGDWLRCGAGARLKAVAQEARRRSLGGLEFLEGIPGSLGGALRMNAGAMGSSIFDRVESVRVMTMDGTVVERARAEIDVRYRSCPWLVDHFALGAVLRGEPATRDSIEARARAFNERRWASQPAAPSAGCIFKNPTQIPAGRLIDELGLKGTRVGGAVVSDVHGNFIVNDGGATASDMLRLIELVRTRAREARGIELETEVQIVGE